MEHNIDGCVNCPFKDSAKGEYDKYCNHPNRPIDVYEIVVEDNKLNNIEILGDLKNILLNEYKEWGNVSIFRENGRYAVRERPLNYLLRHPDWCPLVNEPITITLNK